MNHSPINQARLKKLLAAMLDIYSPSGKEEDLCQYLHGWLKRRGLPVVRQEVDEERGNLVIPLGGEEAELALIGHIDTVSAHELEDFGYRQEGDRVWGLGAADMKGGCAAMIEAVLSLWEQGVRELPVTLALVVGEEEAGDGAEALVNEYRFPWAVVGEPTRLEPCLHNYGYMELKLVTRGERRHASLAGGGRKAVEDMLRLLLTLTAHLQNKRPEVIYNIRDLFSSGGGFVVPEECEAWLDLHLPPNSQASEVAVEIEELVAAEKNSDDGLNLRLDFETVQAGYELPPRGPVVEALQNAMSRMGRPWLPGAFRSHSDANQLWAAGVKPIIMGPGSLEAAHRPEEWVSFSQVAAASELYYRLAQALVPPSGA